MDIKNYLVKMKEFQNIILEYLEEEDSQSKYDEIAKILNNNIEFQQDNQEFKSIISLIIKIANNHHRCSDFNKKIFQILQMLKSQIKQVLSNDDIFNFFKGNKRILLFLIEEEILQINDSIASKMTDAKYSQYKFKEYFFPELKSYLSKEEIEQIKEELPCDFEEKRQIGENDCYICELIRKDMVEDFIAFVNKKNIHLETTIKTSSFETNQFLIMNEPSLIEYSAFYGSIQIFQYLDMNHVEFKPSLWLYVIHGMDAKMIHLLEEREDKPLYNF